MKIIPTLSTFIIAVVLTGCSNTAPKCSDQETQDLVIQISKDELVKQAGKDLASKVKLELSFIRTTDTNEKVGSFKCAAELVAIVDGVSNSSDITYTVELSDNGEEFYVNVFGL